MSKLARNPCSYEPLDQLVSPFGGRSHDDHAIRWIATAAEQLKTEVRGNIFVVIGDEFVVRRVGNASTDSRSISKKIKSNSSHTLMWVIQFQTPGVARN